MPKLGHKFPALVFLKIGRQKKQEKIVIIEMDMLKDRARFAEQDSKFVFKYRPSDLNCLFICDYAAESLTL